MPSVLTLRQLFTKYLDICSVPRNRYFFELLAHFTDDALHKERLQELVQPEFLDDLYNYCYRPRRTFVEILQDFASVRIPLTYLLDVFPLMKFREFSISSACLNEKNVDITVGVVRYTTSLKAPRLGVCTTWLATLPVGSQGNFLIINMNYIV